MSYWTLLMIKVPTEEVEAVGQGFIDRRILEECAETISGFLHGELLSSIDVEGQYCVLCNWTDKSAYDAWVASPVRDKQNADALGFTIDKGFGVSDIRTVAYNSRHRVTGS